MLLLESIYRWCDAYGGGLVVASSIEDARKKLEKKYDLDRGPFIIWPWKKDDYYDENNVDVFDIYG